tara:strand:+ start:2500 stop:5448 length:2949 start_codon:yes stop_codon:yes gene_type:complete
MSDGDTITAALFNNEYNQLVNAFTYSSSSASTTGHRHDGTAGQGGNIHTIGDLDFLNKIVADSTNNRWGFFVEVSSSAVEQIRIQDGAIVPVTDNDIDLGTSSLEFKDAYFDGTVTTDALVADTADINGGSVDGVTLGTNSAITQAVIDSININGTTIGHTSDTDLITLTSGVVTVAGELDATTLDISGDADIDGTTNLDAVDIDGAVQVDGTITVGVDDTGYDVKFFGATASSYMLWDESEDDLVLAGSAGIDLAGDIDVDGTANLDNTDIDGTLAVDGTTISLDATTSLNIDNSNTSNGITIGTVTSGVPISIGHSTSEVTINDNLTVTGTLTLGSGAELSEAELEMLDGITEGTVAASKAVVVDSNKDAASFRNITLTGELDAATLDISGDADIDGTTNLDAVDIDGAVQIDNTVTVGVDDTGYDVKFFGATSGAYMLWDESADDLKLVGAAGLTVAGDIDVDGTANLDVVDIDGAVDMASTLAVTGDATFSATVISNDIEVVGSGGGSTNRLKATYNSSTGVAAFGPDSGGGSTSLQIGTSNSGTYAAALTLAAAGGATFVGEVAAASLDISGNVDIDGTTNLDVVDIDGAVDMASTLAVGGVVTANAGINGTTATFTTADNLTQVRLISTDDDGSIGPRLDFFRNSASPTAGDFTGRMRFLAEDSAGNETAYVHFDTLIDDPTDGSEDGQLRIETKLDGNMVERIGIDSTETVINEDSLDLDFRIESDSATHAFFLQGSSGNVGIGTSSVDARLHVQQGGEPPAEGMLILEANSASRQIRIQPPTDSDNGFIDYRGGNLTFLDDGTEVARFQGSDSFDLKGPKFKIYTSDDQANYYALYNHTDDTLRINYNNAGNDEFLMNSSGDLSTTGTITASQSNSDIRLKENIQVIPDAVSKVKSLRGVTFNFKESGEKSTGLIAQEVQEVLPEAVYTAPAFKEGDDFLALHYGNTVGLLVEAIKEQQSQIESLMKRIEELED